MLTSDNLLKKAITQNQFIAKYIMAIDHALLWVGALSFAAFFHLYPAFSHDEALLYSTLVAYGAYLCESGLATLREAVTTSEYDLDFKRAGMWGWIVLNIGVNVTLSLMFLAHPSWILFVLIILTAGWQKYMDGRIPPRLQATRTKLTLPL